MTLPARVGHSCCCTAAAAIDHGGPSLGTSTSSGAIIAHAPELWAEGIADKDLRSFPVPALLIAGEHDDPDDDAANVAELIPNGQRLRLPGLGHGGSCAASALVIPTACAFLDRWFARRVW
jgi:pimeloyl-ACP methyl ester carboxylesterase